MKRWIIVVSSLTLAFTLQNAEARPKIGLVLGGGGAAGLSHIGVIKVLEEQGIPIDVISGNSMGAIVGGLYASGMSVSELEKTARTLDWFKLFNDTGVYSDQNYQQKQMSGGFFSAVSMGVSKRGIKLPSGLISGQNLMFELRRLLSPVAHINQFDKLPIPFRAVATDIRTGEAVVLKQGNLATAIRASMSIPGLFSPVELNGRLLVDGLVSNNVPVDIARQMGADIVIVSRIPQGKERSLDSALDISLQTMDLLVYKASEDQLKSLTKKDILIQPPIGDIGSLDFQLVGDAIPAGIKGAQAQLAALKQLMSSIGQAPKAKISKPQIPKEGLRLASIQIKNDSVLKTSILQRALNLQAGSAITNDQLQAALNRVYRLGQFSLVDYDLDLKENGQYDLTVLAQKSDQGNRRLNFGFSLSDDFDGDTGYQAGVRFVNKGLTRKGTELRSRAVIGDQILGDVEIFHPFQDKWDSFINPKIAYQEGDIKLLEDGQQVAEIRAKTHSARIDIGRALGKNGEARVGLFYENLKPDVKTGSIDLGTDSLKSAGLEFNYAFDSFDQIDFPTFGKRINANLRVGLTALNSDSAFNRLTVDAEKVWKISEKGRILANGRVTSTSNNENVLAELQDTLQTGRLALSDNTKLEGNYTLEGTVGYLREVKEIPRIAKVHVGASIGLGQVWQKRDDVDLGDLDPSATLYVGTTTPLGPAFLGIRKMKGYDNQAYFNFGRSF
ncbi:patatin-like phospholipase family protein [Thiofilum flexile]|uniref:patatin-like phospholipase family protein n=1 Tax=Thiofilum flexile TaxID=125627 RepID=UPI000376227E|nr:patatin-like phospholipase family protein [Thiofilum flexile]